jgi:hypothetical protein
LEAQTNLTNSDPDYTTTLYLNKTKLIVKGAVADGTVRINSEDYSDVIIVSGGSFNPVVTGNYIITDERTGNALDTFARKNYVNNAVSTAINNMQLPEHYKGQFGYLIVGEDEPAGAAVGATAIVVNAVDSADIYNAVAVEGDGGAVEWDVDDTPVPHLTGNYWYILDLGTGYNNKPGSVTDNGVGYDFAADNWHEPNGTEIRVNPDTQLLELVDDGVTGAKVAGKTITFGNMADVTVTNDTNGKINENLLKIAPGTYPWYVTAPDGNPAGLVPELVRKYNGVVTCLETLGRGEHPDDFAPFWRQIDYYIDVENISDITPPDDGGVYTAIVADCANVADLTLIPAGKGDVDGDGFVTPIDRWLISRYRSGEITLTPEQLSAADIDGDGSVNSFDMGLILNELANHSSTPTRAVYAEWQNGTWVLLPYSPMQTLIDKKGIIFAYSKNGMVEELKYPGLLVSDGAGNVVDLGGNFSGVLEAVAGKADKPGVVINETDAAVSFGLLDNTYFKFTQPLTYLEITGTPLGDYQMCQIRFTTDSGGFSFVDFISLSWSGFDPATEMFETNATYEINIFDGVGVCYKL